jgi:hypothetical protein
MYQPPPGAAVLEATRGRYTQRLSRAQALHFTKITYKCALALLRMLLKKGKRPGRTGPEEGSTLDKPRMSTLNNLRRSLKAVVRLLLDVHANARLNREAFPAILLGLPCPSPPSGSIERTPRPSTGPEIESELSPHSRHLRFGVTLLLGLGHGVHA